LTAAVSGGPPSAARNIEGVKLDLVVLLAAVQPLEIRDAVDAEQHRLAIDYERAGAVLERGLDDARIAFGHGRSW
jgi:hypothetical protein